MASILKNVARAALGRVRCRILGGPAKGLWWSVATRSRFIRGTYEPRMANFFADLVKPDDVVWDVGAHFGYYTVISARRAEAGEVFAFEPTEANRKFLRQHVGWNRAEGVRILPCAVGETDGTSSFGTERGSGSGRIGGEGGEIAVRSVDSLIEKDSLSPPTVMKVDVEGAEVSLLKGASSLLSTLQTTLVIATHPGIFGEAIHHDCVPILRGHGFHVYESLGDSLMLAVPPGKDLGEDWARGLFESDFRSWRD